MSMRLRSSRKPEKKETKSVPKKKILPQKRQAVTEIEKSAKKVQKVEDKPAVKNINEFI